MRKTIRMMGLLIFMLCIPTYAQMYKGGCNWVQSQLQWKDGESLTTMDVQLVLQRLNLPQGFSMVPQSSIDTVLDLSPVSILKLQYHCDPSQEQVPQKLVTFYFSYQNGGKVVKLPEIHIFIYQ